jgi:hypothetical protein
MYCLAVNRHAYSFMNHQTPIPSSMQNNPKVLEAQKMHEADLANLDYKIKKLQAYIAIHIESLDPLPLQVSYRSGENDFNELMNYLNDPESQKADTICEQEICKGLPQNALNKCIIDNIVSCNKKNTPDVIKTISTKTKSCQDLSWMPF